jgi:hypothetical protein
MCHARIPAEVVDRPAATDEERGAHLRLVYDQLKEVRSGGLVQCPCGKRSEIVLTFQCYFCRVWFCMSCASRHFATEE